jgi:hypothetical protein
VIAGWAGVVLVLGARWRDDRVLYAAGLVLLAVAWGVAFARTDVRTVTVLTSPPCLVLLGQERWLVAVGERRSDDAA